MADNAKVTAERIRFMFNYDPLTGALTWRNPTSNNVVVGQVAGGQPRANGRRYVLIDGEQCLAHRVAWLHYYGKWPVENVSALNGDYTDLRLSNLVLKTPSETARSGARKTNTSGYRGVSWDKRKKKWQATITQDYKAVMIGRFDTAEEAAEAYAAAALERDKKPIITDTEGRRERSARVSLRVELRRKWRKMIRANGGVVGWGSFSDFAAEIGDAIPRRHDITGVDGIPGPGNWQWTPIDSPKFDYKSSSGRLAANRAYRAANRDHYKNKELKRTFGITMEEYQQMLVAQNGVCAICKQPETEIRRGKLQTLSVDHCHKTNAVRALLCGFCNRGIGYLKDNPALLREAAFYVEHHTKRLEDSAASTVPLPKEGALGANGHD